MIRLPEFPQYGEQKLELLVPTEKKRLQPRTTQAEHAGEIAKILFPDVVESVLYGDDSLYC
jgi:hypothetical protein